MIDETPDTTRFNEQVRRFMERWNPDSLHRLAERRPYEFEAELVALIRAAHQDASRPFIKAMMPLYHVTLGEPKIVAMKPSDASDQIRSEKSDGKSDEISETL